MLKDGQATFTTNADLLKTFTDIYQAPAQAPARRATPGAHVRPKWWWFPYAIVAPAVLLELGIHHVPLLTGVWMSFVKLADGREFWFLVSEHPDAVDVSLEGRDLTTLDGREASHLHLEPWGVQVVVRHNEENR